MAESKGDQTQMAGYYSPQAVTQLRKLSDVARIPQSAYLRESLDDLPVKYASVLRPMGRK